MRLGLRIVGLGLGLACGGALALAQDTPIPFATPDIAFAYRASLLGTPVSGTVPACPLQDPSDKPDGVAPAHTAILFKGAPPLPDDAFAACALPNFDRAEIRVFPVAEFGHVHAPAKASLAALDTLLASGGYTPGTDLPFVPFVDAHPAFVEHVAFLRFQNGRAVAFLTQWMIEPDSIGNALVLVVQGLSDDGARYVLGVFPVRPVRPLEPFPARPSESYEQALKRYGPYAVRSAAAVRALPDGAFTPDLAALRELFESLRVK